MMLFFCFNHITFTNLVWYFSPEIIFLKLRNHNTFDRHGNLMQNYNWIAEKVLNKTFPDNAAKWSSEEFFEKYYAKRYNVFFSSLFKATISCTAFWTFWQLIYIFKMIKSSSFNGQINWRWTFFISTIFKSLVR